MSRLFTIAIVAALLVVPSSAAVRADEASSETKQPCDKEKCKDGDCKKDCKECCKEGKCEKECGKEGCDKKECCKDACKEGCDKKQCCKEGECNKEACCKGECASKTAKCTMCKCESCDNAQCNTENCQCAASKTCDSKCEGAACCDQTAEAGAVDFRALTLVAAGIQGECASGKCCKSNCSDNSCCKEGKICCDASKCIAGECCPEGSCCEDGIAGCIDGSTLHWEGNSIFAVTTPSPTSVETIDTLRWAARDWAIRCDESCPTSTQQFRVKVASTSEENIDSASAIYAQPVPAITRATDRSTITKSESPKQFTYSIQIVEDHADCFGEYEGLRNGRPMICAESKTLLPTIRTLAKHQLIKQVSSPRITCDTGQKAELEVNSRSSGEPQCLNIEVASAIAPNDQMMVEINLCSGEERDFNVCTATVVEAGQSIVLKATRPTARTEEAEAIEPAVFIVVTPEIVE